MRDGEVKAAGAGNGRAKICLFSRRYGVRTQLQGKGHWIMRIWIQWANLDKGSLVVSEMQICSKVLCQLTCELLRGPGWKGII